MKVQFINPRIIEGIKYNPGINDFPDSLANHWYLKACLQNGDAFIRENPKAVIAADEDDQSEEVVPELPKSEVHSEQKTNSKKSKKEAKKKDE